VDLWWEGRKHIKKKERPQKGCGDKIDEHGRDLLYRKIKERVPVIDHEIAEKKDKGPSRRINDLENLKNGKSWGERSGNRVPL